MIETMDLLVTRPAGASSPRRRALYAALTILALLVLVALLAPWLSPYDPKEQLDIIELKSQSPSLAHPFGTDDLSRDVLSRVLHGARMSLSVAGASALLAISLGTIYGAFAGMVGGFTERAMMRILDVLLAIPRLLILLAITAFWQKLQWDAIVLLFGLTGWYQVARLVRAETSGLLARDFVLAARASGVRSVRLLGRHLLPHLLPTLAVSATLAVAYSIAMEAGLGYLGLGLQEPDASWGTIMKRGAGFIDIYWWLTVFPGLATVITVLACNALGDALRDVFASEQVPA